MAEITIKKGKINGYCRIKANAKRDRKRREAEYRQANWDALPLEEKLKLMGKKHRARWDKQQAELAKKRSAPPTPKPVVSPKPELKQPETKAKKQSKKKIVEAAKMERPSKS